MLKLLLILSVVCGGLAAATFSRFAALLLYLWFSFFRPQEWVWQDISGLRLSLIIAASLVLPSFLTGILPDVRQPISRGLLCLMGAALVAEFLTPHPRESWEWLQFVAQSGLVSLLLVTLVNTPDRLRWTMLVVTGSIGLHAATSGLHAVMSPGARTAEGIGGAFGDNNSYAVACAMLVPMFLGLASAGWSKWWMRPALMVAALLSAVTVASTMSRGGFLAISAGILLYSLSGGIKMRWLLPLPIAAMLILPFVPLPEGYGDRLGTIRTYEKDESASSRLHFWRVALDMAVANPLGVGVQNFNNVFDDFDFSNGRYGNGRSVHNSHLQILTESGFFGFFVWVSMLCYALVVTWRARRRAAALPESDQRVVVGISQGLFAATGAFMVGGTFTAIGWNDFVWCVLAIVASVDAITSAALATDTVSIPASPVTQHHDRIPSTPAPGRISASVLNPDWRSLRRH